ncbi:MAG TPA: acetyl-CoA carboxylase biotin carboxyl carrier protein subunit [Acetobacteraceae bacterium]|jgi:acetyl-CoA carboxylase biotin carboxyl carrier protein|nr:acetyl-CoA carboxylase biotin carboxyl carrier protein subunit [Acetobacteraceae bacterium]
MSALPFDPDAIRALAALLKETGLTEIEVAEKEGRIRVARQPGQPAAAAAGAAPVSAPLPTAETAEAEDAANHPGAIKSPMVGIVYLAPDPGAAPFVALGQDVEAGQTLLLVEAMKTFNQIKAPRAGRLSRILVRSGTPVEYGEPLMILE